MIAGLLLAAAAPQPGTVHTYGDWSIACDNVKRCGAAPLVPAEAEDEDLTLYAARREAGPEGRATLSFYTEGRKGEIVVRVDGREIARLRLSGKVSTELTGDPALAVLRAAANGRRMELVDAGRGAIGEVSLAGAAAAFRFADAEQRRTGSVTAIVARGPAPAARVPPAPVQPTIRGVRPGGTIARLSQGDLARLRRKHGCEVERFDESMRAVDHAALGGGATLALIPCHMAAYQGSSLVYVVRRGTPAPARFDTAEEDSDPELTSPGWDAEAAALGTYHKGRGLADCGQSQSFVWDGARFRLVEQEDLEPCRGNRDLIRTWTARVVR